MYIINVTEVDTGAQFQYTSVNTQYTLHSLHPYYTYEFVIEAVTVAPGPPTLAFSIQTKQDGKLKFHCYREGISFYTIKNLMGRAHAFDFYVLVCESKLPACCILYRHVCISSKVNACTDTMISLSKPEANKLLIELIKQFLLSSLS